MKTRPKDQLSQKNSGRVTVLYSGKATGNFKLSACWQAVYVGC